MPNGALQDRVVVVIGGTSGIGLSAAMACRAAGARIVAVGRDDEHLKTARDDLGDDSIVLAGDAAVPEAARGAIGRAVDAFGRFDALYHVAGGSGRRAGDGPLHEITDAGWDFTIRLNLTSVFHSNRAAAEAFMKRGTGGSVLNLASVLAFSPSPSHFSTHAYAAAKAGIIGLTQAAAAHYAPRDIRFNVLAPGLVETPMSRRAVQDERIMKYVATKQTLDGGRIGRPDDLDAAAVYFLSDASRFVTGQVLSVDGGWSVTEGRRDD